MVAESSSSAVPLPASLNTCFTGPGPEEVSTKGGACLLHVTGLPYLHHRIHSGVDEHLLCGTLEIWSPGLACQRRRVSRRPRRGKVCMACIPLSIMTDAAEASRAHPQAAQ